MRWVRVLKNLLIGETLLVLLVVAGMRRSGYANWILAVILLMQAGIIFYWIKAALLPLKNFTDAVNDLMKEAGQEDKLKSISEDIPYIGQIKELIDIYATQKTRENSAQIFDKQTELTALQSQINPHFLYNTLESIRGQALMDDNVEIARMVEALAAFFRYSISKKGNLVTLRDELANIDNYMMIQRYRFNNRFSMEIIIDDEDEAAYDFLIPRLIIQPVVENAIFHGLEERLEGGKVIIEVIVTEQNLMITISDNGNGIESGKLEKLNARIHSRNIQLEDGRSDNQRNTGIALPNIHKRIQLLFGEEYGVNVYSTVGQGTDVEITIPANYQRGRGMGNEERDIADQ